MTMVALIASVWNPYNPPENRWEWVFFDPLPTVQQAMAKASDIACHGVDAGGGTGIRFLVGAIYFNQYQGGTPWQRWHGTCWGLPAADW